MRLTNILKKVLAFVMIFSIICSYPTEIKGQDKTNESIVGNALKLNMFHLQGEGGGIEYGYNTIKTGPDGYSAAAFKDKDAGILDLYLGTSSGVQRWNSEAGTGMETMKGIEGQVFAIGGKDKNNMAAVSKVKTVLGSGMSSYWFYNFYIYKYDSGIDLWNKIENSDFGYEKNYASNDYKEVHFMSNEGKEASRLTGTEYNNPYGFVISPDDIWLADIHWNGQEWIKNEHYFVSLLKLNEETAYGMTEDGKLYIYDAATGK